MNEMKAYCSPVVLASKDVTLPFYYMWLVFERMNHSLMNWIDKHVINCVAWIWDESHPVDAGKGLKYSKFLPATSLGKTPDVCGCDFEWEPENVNESFVVCFKCWNRNAKREMFLWDTNRTQHQEWRVTTTTATTLTQQKKQHCESEKLVRLIRDFSQSPRAREPSILISTLCEMLDSVYVWR